MKEIRKDYAGTADLREPGMTDFAEYTVQNGAAQLFCRKRGEGPAFLLIHGVASDADYFEDAAKLLAKKFTVITYDRRGYSRSADGETEQILLTNQAEDAAAVLRVSGAENVFVAASSAGCLVASELARLYPELVRGLFLHEPVFAANAQMKAEIEALDAKLREAAEKKRVIRGMRHFLDAMGGTDSRAESKPLEKQAQNIRNLETFLYREMNDFFHYNIENLRSLKIPVQIAVGECDGAGLFHRAAEAAAEAFGWRLVRVPGYHNFPSDLPYEFAEAIAGAYDLLPD